MIDIRALRSDDAEQIAASFAAIGWADNKPTAQYHRYYEEQQKGERDVVLAFREEVFAGYVTVVWRSPYAPFARAHIPEVQDFNVLPRFRRQGIGTRLMDEAERMIALRSSLVGIGVGMYPDYGNAQILYVRRGYVPDGRGLTYRSKVLAPMAEVINDDDLVLYFTKRLDRKNSPE